MASTLPETYEATHSNLVLLAMTSSPKQYDLIVIGATGFTGALVAEYITSKGSKTIQWAIVGRSLSKLNALQQKLKCIDSERVPEVKTVELETVALQSLVSKTKVLINAIGPYCVYSEPVLAACVEAGTAYLDFCTETPWLQLMILHYHERAIETGARIIPAIGNSSSPSDLVSWLIANSTSGHYGENVDNIICSFDMKINGMSSGSLSTVTNVVAKYGISFLWSPKQYALVPSKITQESAHVPMFQRLFGYSRHIPLGRLTTSFAAAGNVAIVQRSAHLNPSIYPEDFSYQEYMPVASILTAVLIHLLTKLGILLLTLPFFRSFLDHTSKGSGCGPDPKAAEGEYIRLHAVGTSRNVKEPVHALYEFAGGMYLHSAMLAVEAAITMLEQSEDGRQAGFLTPSSLGMPFVEKLKHAGVRCEVI
jgi:short subunit dehydrogenase-like uncharacterized protein